MRGAGGLADANEDEDVSLQMMLSVIMISMMGMSVQLFVIWTLISEMMSMQSSKKNKRNK